jgi:hypothetical protein
MNTSTDESLKFQLKTIPTMSYGDSPSPSEKLAIGDARGSISCQAATSRLLPSSESRGSNSCETGVSCPLPDGSESTEPVPTGYNDRGHSASGPMVVEILSSDEEMYAYLAAALGEPVNSKQDDRVEKSIQPLHTEMKEEPTSPGRQTFSGITLPIREKRSRAEIEADPMAFGGFSQWRVEGELERLRPLT